MGKTMFDRRFFFADKGEGDVSFKLGYVYSVLSRNRNMNFVRRILDRSLNKGFKMPDTGREATHYMVYSRIDGLWAVYPRIVDMGDGDLVLLSEDEAENHARSTREYIGFDTKSGAEWFSYHYKDIWKRD